MSIPALHLLSGILKALSTQCTKSNAIRSQQLLEKLELPVELGGYDVEPDTMSYSLTIFICSTCDDAEDGAVAAERVLQAMETRAATGAARQEELSSTAPPTVCLTVGPYNEVLKAISRKRRDQTPKRAMGLIERLRHLARQGGMEAVRPNLVSWNAALLGLSRASGTANDPGYAKMAEQILDSLHQNYKNGVVSFEPNAFTYGWYVRFVR
jgi:hypothetical protein